jgi:hypothetical protein
MKILLIDKQVDFNLSYINDNTIPIYYDRETTPYQILSQIEGKQVTNIGILFHGGQNTDLPFINYSTFFNQRQFLIDLCNRFSLVSLDFISCETGKCDRWLAFYNELSKSTTTKINYSTEKIGNGYWSLCDSKRNVTNVSPVYFNSSISLYSSVLSLVSSFSIISVSTTNVTLSFTVTGSCYLYRFIGIPSPISPLPLGGTLVQTIPGAATATINDTGLTPDTIYTYAFYNGNTSGQSTVYTPYLTLKTYLDVLSMLANTITETTLRLNYTLSNRMNVSSNAYLYQFNSSSSVPTVTSTLDPSSANYIATITVNPAINATTPTVNATYYNVTSLTSNNSYGYGFYDGQALGSKLLTDTTGNNISSSATTFTTVGSMTTSNIGNTVLSVNYTLTNAISTSTISYLYRFTGSSAPNVLDTTIGTSIGSVTNTSGSTVSSFLNSTGLSSNTQYTYAFYNGNVNNSSTILRDALRNVQYISVTTANVLNTDLNSTNVGATSATLNYTLTNSGTTTTLYLYRYINATTAPSVLNSSGVNVTSVSVSSVLSGSYTDTGLVANTKYAYAFYSGNVTGLAAILTSDGTTPIYNAINTTVTTDSFTAATSILNNSMIINYNLTNVGTPPLPISYLYGFTGASAPSLLSGGFSITSSSVTGAGSFNVTGLSSGTQYTYAFYNSSNSGALILTNASGVSQSLTVNTANLFNTTIGSTTILNTTATISYTLTNTGTNTSAITTYLYRFNSSNAPVSNPVTTGTQLTSVALGVNGSSTSTYNNTGLTAGNTYTYAFYNGNVTASTILTNISGFNQSYTLMTTNVTLNNLSSSMITTTSAVINYTLSNFTTTQNATVYLYRSTAVPGATLATASQTNITSAIVTAGNTISGNYTNTGLTTNTIYYYAFYNGNTNGSSTLLPNYITVADFPSVTLSASNVSITSATITYTIVNNLSVDVNSYLYRFSGSTAPSTNPSGNGGTQVTNSGVVINPISTTAGTTTGPTSIVDANISANNTYTYALYNSTSGNILVNTAGTAVSVTIVTSPYVSSINLTGSNATSTNVNYTATNPTSLTSTIYLYRFPGNSAPSINPNTSGTNVLVGGNPYLSTITNGSTTNASVLDSSLTPNNQYTWAFYSGNVSSSNIITNATGGTQTVTLLTAMYARTTSSITTTANTYTTISYRLASAGAISQTSYLYRFVGASAPSILNSSGVLILNTTTTSTTTYNNTGLAPSTQYTYAFYNGNVTGTSTILYGGSSTAVNVPLTAFSMSTTTSNLLNTTLTASSANSSANISYTLTNLTTSSTGTYYLYRFTGAAAPSVLNTSTGTAVTTASNTLAANGTVTTSVTDTGLSGGTQYTYAFYNGNTNGLSTILTTDGTTAKSVSITTTGVFQPSFNVTSITTSGALLNYTMTNVTNSPATVLYLYGYNSTAAPASYDGLGTLITTMNISATSGGPVNTSGSFNVTGLTNNTVNTFQFYNGNVSGYSQALQTTLAGGTQQTVSIKTNVSDVSLTNSGILNSSAIINYTLANTLNTTITSYLYRFVGSTLSTTLNTSLGTLVANITTGPGSSSVPLINTSTLNSTGLNTNTTYVYGFYNGTTNSVSTLLTNATGGSVSTSLTTTNLLNTNLAFSSLTTTSVTISYTLNNTGTSTPATNAYLYRFNATGSAPSSNPTSGTQILSVPVGANSGVTSTYNNTSLTPNTQYTYAFYNGTSSSSTILTNSGLTPQSVTIFTTNDIIVNKLEPVTIGPVIGANSQTNLSYALVNYQNATKTAYFYRFNSSNAPSTLNTSGIQMTNASNPVIPVSIGANATSSSSSYNNTGLATNTFYTYAFYNSTTSGTASILKNSAGNATYTTVYTTDNAIVNSLSSSNLGNTINTINWYITNNQNANKIVYLYRFPGNTVPSPLDLTSATLLNTLNVTAGTFSNSLYNDSNLSVNTNYSYAFYTGNVSGVSMPLTTFSGTNQVLNIATTQVYNPTLSASGVTQSSAQINYYITNTPASSGDIMYLYRFIGTSAPTTLATTNSATQLTSVTILANGTVNSQYTDSTISSNNQYTYAFYNGNTVGVAQILTYSSLSDYASVTVNTFYDVISSLNSTGTTNNSTIVTYTLQDNLSTDSTAYLYRFDGNITPSTLLNTGLYNATNVSSVPVISGSTLNGSFYDASLSRNATYTYAFYSGTTNGVSTVLTNLSNVAQKTVVTTLNVYNPTLTAPVISTNSVTIGYTINNVTSNANATVYLYRYYNTTSASPLLNTSTGTLLTSFTVPYGNATTSTYIDNTVTVDDYFTYAFYNGNTNGSSPILQDNSVNLNNVSITVYTFYDIVASLTASSTTNKSTVLSYSIQNTLTSNTTGYLYRYNGLITPPNLLNLSTATFITSELISSGSTINKTYPDTTLSQNSNYTYAFYSSNINNAYILTNVNDTPVYTSVSTGNVYNPVLTAPTITASSVTLNYTLNNVTSSSDTTVYLYRYNTSTAFHTLSNTAILLTSLNITRGQTYTSSYTDSTVVADNVYTYGFYDGNQTNVNTLLQDNSVSQTDVSQTVYTFYDIIANLTATNIQNTSADLSASIQNTLTTTTTAYLYRFDGWIIPDVPLNTSLLGCVNITSYTIIGSSILNVLTTDNTLSQNTTYTYVLYNGTTNGVSVALTDLYNNIQYVVVTTTNILPPVSYNVDVFLDQDTSTFIVLNSVDPQSSPLTYSYTYPSNGSIIGTAPNLVYIPNAGYYGLDSMTYYATNSYGYSSNTATVSITVNQVQPGPVPCFAKGSMISCLDEETCREVEIAVEALKPGMLVKTLRNGYIPLHQLGKSHVYNSKKTAEKDRLYVLRPCHFPQLKRDLILTGGHSVLVDTLTKEQIRKTKEISNCIFVTDDKYRLLTSLVEKAEPYDKEGVFDIYHFSLDHNDVLANYGVYANGMLVETCSIYYLREHSRMKL